MFLDPLQFPNNGTMPFLKMSLLFEDLHGLSARYGRRIIAELLEKADNDQFQLSESAQAVLTQSGFIEDGKVIPDLKMVLPYVVTLTSNELYFFVLNAGSSAYQQTVQEVVASLTPDEIQLFMVGIKHGYPLKGKEGYEKIVELCTEEGLPMPGLKMGIMTASLDLPSE